MQELLGLPSRPHFPPVEILLSFYAALLILPLQFLLYELVGLLSPERPIGFLLHQLQVLPAPRQLEGCLLVVKDQSESHLFMRLVKLELSLQVLHVPPELRVKHPQLPLILRYLSLLPA
jgi:hypothetical protein